MVQQGRRLDGETYDKAMEYCVNEIFMSVCPYMDVCVAMWSCACWRRPAIIFLLVIIVSGDTYTSFWIENDVFDIAYTMAGKSQMNDNIPISPDNNHNKVTNILNATLMDNALL